MNRVHTTTLRLLTFFLFLFLCIAVGTQAQTPSPTPEAKSADQVGGDPFGLEYAKPLPPGMKGSNASDPRSKLRPGLYDAGETANGLRHVLLLKKPEAFQLGTTDVKSPRVKQTLGSLGVSDPAMIPPTVALSFASLAFANSDATSASVSAPGLYIGARPSRRFGDATRPSCGCVRGFWLTASVMMV